MNSTQEQTGLDRRKFLKIFGSGLAVALVLPDIRMLASDTAAAATTLPTSQVGAWLHIAENGKVHVYTGKVEVGQNIRTTLSQIVCEELEIPLSSVEMTMGDTDLVPYDAGTFGSRSTPQMGTQLRRAAATARRAMLEMAAKNWQTKPELLRLEQGSVTETGSGKKIAYGELVKGQQMLMSIPDDIPVVAPADWKVAGKSIKKVNGRSFLTGRHQYVSDMKLPGMLHAKVLRPPAFEASLVSVDTAAARSMSGVVVVQEGDFIAVAAPSAALAEKALQKIKADWKTVPQPARKDIFEYLVTKASAAGGGRNAPAAKGDFSEGLRSAAFQHQATYNIHYIAHVPLEPRAALAQWENDKLTVYTGTQRPFGVQESLATFFELPKEKVRVVMPDTGSAYGGKHSGEAAEEAARIALAAKKPVKLVWTRKEEFTWAYFRPGGVIKVSAGVQNDGTITAWKFDNYNSGGAGLSTQYGIAHQQIAHHPSDSPLKQGSYRGLASTANVFARECHIEDLARMAKMDSLAFRLKNLEDARLKAALEAAARAFGWDAQRGRSGGKGMGLACGFEKGGYVGTCVELVVQPDKSVKILRVTQAFECGAIINPHHLENQVMGSIVQGLGGALFEAIDFADGKILNGNLSAYRVPRFSDMPKIDIVLLDRKDLPSAGAGEAAIVGIAPAIRNAILDATGVALKQLPLLPEGGMRPEA